LPVLRGGVGNIAFFILWSALLAGNFEGDPKTPHNDPAGIGIAGGSGGLNAVLEGDLPGGSLFKVTVAPQITPALKFLSRPSLRAFVTWAHWSDTFRGQIAAASDPDAVRGTAVGVQLESWW